MTRDEAIEKIKKLLRMKRGGTEAEVATALALAQEIARKHGIDISAVNPDEEDQVRPIGHEAVFFGRRIQFECTLAGLICEQFFNVSVFASKGWRTNALVFVGTEWDRQIATYVYKFLVRHFRYCWNKKSGRCRNRRAFMWGIYNGLGSNLRQAMPKAEGSALVLIGKALQRRNLYIGEHFGELKSSNIAPDHDADEAYYRGFLAGKDTNIRPAVDHAQPKPKEIGI